MPKHCVRLFATAALAVMMTSSAIGDESTGVRRTNNRSPEFRVAEADVGYFMNYTGFADGERFFKGTIGPKVLDMIEAAERHIIFSVFLFDSFYAEGEVDKDVVSVLAQAFVDKRKSHPDIRIALILDPSHKAYGRRVSPVAERLRANGIDIFYSDLISGLKKASFIGVREGAGHVNRVIDTLTLGVWGNGWSKLFSRGKLPVEFDDEQLSLEAAYNAALLKANHRKLLVTDVQGEAYETMFTSANPHNASAYHVNSAITVKGVTARYVYNVLRKDMKHSAGLGVRYVHWHHGVTRAYRKSYFNEAFPKLDLSTRGEGDVAVRVVTESKIPEEIIRQLERVQEGDEVRIQMFYLSFQPVLDAILKASRQTDKPVRLLLDANKDSFNKVKDGTPNRQVARYLLNEAEKTGGRIDVRWYSTHGEQNHAKTMSITNKEKKRYVITTGSCNWTGRNMDGVNMEANVVVEHSAKLNASFNEYFDLFWRNSDGSEYSVDYEVFSDAASDRKWRRGEKPYYLSTF